MCWAACDRLGRIAARLGLAERAAYWFGHATQMHEMISKKAWNRKRGSFVSTFDGKAMDASLLLLAEVGFLDAADPRFAATVSAVEKDLRHGDLHFPLCREGRFRRAGERLPGVHLLVCQCAGGAGPPRRGASFVREAACLPQSPRAVGRTHRSSGAGEQWGNFVQTYSMVGLINAAIRLSMRWDQAF
jgi:hypothetical protein